MGIYRGAGGTGDAVNDASSEATLVQELVSGATTQANNAAASATAAQLAETNAETAETNAETAATSAAVSGAAASTSASNASTSASNAASSASSASTSATNAANSASAASTSASNASSSASTATTQATNASNSASAAATSATNASNSASSAATSATNAAASYDAFDDRYLGSKSSAPTLDNDGNALLTGALYFDTTSSAMKVYNGSTWLDAYASLSGALLATNNLSDLNNTATARTNLGLGTGNSPTFTALNVGAGTVSAPAITTTGDTNTGIFFPAADTIAFTEGGVEAMRITSAGDVGIGTASPSYKLEVNGSNPTAAVRGNALTNLSVFSAEASDYATSFRATRVIQHGSSATGTTFGLSNTSLGYLLFQNTSVGAIGTNGGTPLVFATTSAERMRIDSAGNVGIGTSSPTTRLHLDITGSNAAAATSVGAFQINQAGITSLVGSSGIEFKCSTFGSGYGGKLVAFDDSSLIFANRANSATWSERMRIDSAGNVGIGAVSPAAKLDIYTNIAAGFHYPIFFSANNSAAAKRDYLQLGFSIQQGAAGQETGGFDLKALRNNTPVYLANYEGAPTAGTWKFYTEGTERMRITATGDVGIGTSSPFSKLNVSQSSTDTSAYYNGSRLTITNSSATANNFNTLSFTTASGNDAAAIWTIIGSHTASSATGTLVFGTTNASSVATERMRIDSSGNVGIGTNSPSSFAKLAVLQTSGSNAFQIATTTNGAGVYIQPNNGGTTSQLSYGSIYAFGTSDAQPLLFNTSNTERMRIDASGIITATAGNLMLVSATEIASTSGTSIDFTSIPSWVKRITVMFNGVSTNGTSPPLIQIGDSGGIENTGYNSTGSTAGDSNTTSLSTSTAGFIIRSTVATNTISAQMVISNVSGNVWISSHSGKVSTANSCFGGGDKTLSATLDRVRITTVNGTDTFDAGSINILYE